MATKQDQEDLFQKASKVRKQKQENQSGGFGGGGQYEEVTYTALESNEPKVVRIVGNPMENRQTRFDPKPFQVSMIRGDNGKQFRCIWPDKSENADWILWKVFDKVMKYDYDRVRNEKRYHYAESHPELFNRVNKNDKVDVVQEKGWKPQRAVAMNILDRHDMEWHRENQHTKLLSKKASESGDTVFFEPGIPQYLYDTIWDDVVEYSGDWNNWDVVILKMSKDPFYKAFHPEDDQKKIVKIDPEVLDLTSTEPLTEEEAGWERYDLDRLFPVTSHTKIKNRLGSFIKKVDAAFGTKYYEELEYQAEKEKEERERKAQEENEKEVTESSKTSAPNEKETPDDDPEEEEETEPEPAAASAKAPVRKRTAASQPKTEDSIPWDALQDGSYNGTRYLGVNQLTDEEKAMVTGIDENGQFEYVKTWNGREVELLQNPNNDFVSPGDFHVDPKSGEIFE